MFGPPRATAMQVYAALLRSTPNSVRERALHKIRALLVRLGDPKVVVDVAGMALQMPMSHDLPLYMARFPLYSRNLGRLAVACADAYSDLAVVDIGANIGDSLAFLCRTPVVQVLCIEGDRRYLEFLRTNAAAASDRASIAPVLLGERTGDHHAAFVTSQGTGGFRTFSGASSAGNVQTVSLDDLLYGQPLRGRFKLLKCDTDGFEAHVFRGAMHSIRRHRPVLFFEYHPQLLATNGTDGLELLEMVRKESYSGAIIYDNFGDLLLTLRLDDLSLLEELHRYFDGRGAHQYLDIAAFHSEDDELYESFRQREHDFYRGLMPGATPR